MRFVNLLMALSCFFVQSGDALWELMQEETPQ